MPITQTPPTIAGSNYAQWGANWRVQFIQPDGLPLTMAGLEVIDFGAISYKEIFQNVKTILATPLYSCPLERTLGLDNTIVDRPINNAADVTIAILAAVNQWEPRCKVMSITFTADPINGHLMPNLQIFINNVIYGTNTPYEQNSIYQQIVQGAPDMGEPVPGPIGPPGPTGPRGSLWFVGTTDPDPSIGTGTSGPVVQANDMYLNTTSGDVFQFVQVTSGGTSRKRLQWQKVGKPPPNGRTRP